MTSSQHVLTAVWDYYWLSAVASEGTNRTLQNRREGIRNREFP